MGLPAQLGQDRDFVCRKIKTGNGYVANVRASPSRWGCCHHVSYSARQGRGRKVLKTLLLCQELLYAERSGIGEHPRGCQREHYQLEAQPSHCSLFYMPLPAKTLLMPIFSTPNLSGRRGILLRSSSSIFRAHVHCTITAWVILTELKSAVITSKLYLRLLHRDTLTTCTLCPWRTHTRHYENTTQDR